jgi:cell division septum initiation protein DivIVA
MKKLLTFVLIIICTNSFGQSIQKVDFETEIKSINARLKSLQYENEQLKSNLKSVNSKLSRNAIRVDSLKNLLVLNSHAIAQASSDLGSKIQETGKTNEAKISAVDQSLSKSSLFGIIGVLLLLLISGLVYWLLSKRQRTDKFDMIEELSRTKSSIEESLISEFTKQTNLMDSELQILEMQKANNSQQPVKEVDHSLALKLASEINLIERNIKLMDAKTKGLKQLVASVGKLKDNLNANGYEMVELLGKPFHPGMKVIVTSSIPDENLEPGVEQISKIIIPQVNYSGVMIQTAQLEVSVG